MVRHACTTPPPRSGAARSLRAHRLWRHRPDKRTAPSLEKRSLSTDVGCALCYAFLLAAYFVGIACGKTHHNRAFSAEPFVRSTRNSSTPTLSPSQTTHGSATLTNCSPLFAHTCTTPPLSTRLPRPADDTRHSPHFLRTLSPAARNATTAAHLNRPPRPLSLTTSCTLETCTLLTKPTTHTREARWNRPSPDTPHGVRWSTETRGGYVIFV